MFDQRSESRRRFLKRLGWAAAGLVVADTALQLAYEERWVQVTRPRLSIRDLPPAFEGMTIGHITDVHHGPYLGIERVREIARLAQTLKPDLWVITGDMVHREPKYIEPVWQAFASLEAPLGVWCVMGNHDYWEGIERSRAAAAHVGIPELDNTARPLRRSGQHLWLAGVGDKWCDDQLLSRALEALPERAVALLLAHNPEVASDMQDPRVKLMLAGHSHGGQVVLPLYGPISVPNDRRYTKGLVRTEVSQVYISRGLGMATLPFRLNCRPELPVYELRGG